MLNFCSLCVLPSPTWGKKRQQQQGRKSKSPFHLSPSIAACSKSGTKWTHYALLSAVKPLAWQKCLALPVCDIGYVTLHCMNQEPMSNSFCLWLFLHPELYNVNLILPVVISPPKAVQRQTHSACGYFSNQSCTMPFFSSLPARICCTRGLHKGINICLNFSLKSL